MKIVGKYILRIFLFLVLISSLLYLYIEKLKDFYLTNQTLNSIIIFVIIVGIIYIFRQTLLLKNEYNWLTKSINSQQPSKLSVKSPTLLKYLDTFLKEHSGKFIFSQSAMKSIMESLDGRLTESREISKYLIGLTVFLGLLGTFWGLLETINSVGVTVSGLNFSEDTQKLFKVLREIRGNPDKTTSFREVQDTFASAVASSAIIRSTGQTVTEDQLLARSQGTVMNPNAELLFAGPVLRDFNFDFLMVARSKREGEEIRKIIRWFKTGMAPQFNSAALLNTPNIFTLEYKRGQADMDVLNTVNRFSKGGLALRTFAVDYAPNGYWSAYQDSQPVALKCSMNFAELRPIYQRDQEDTPENSVGY